LALIAQRIAKALDPNLAQLQERLIALYRLFSLKEDLQNVAGSSIKY